MTKSVHLNVKNGKVDAYEGSVTSNGGHFNAKPGEEVKWDGKYKEDGVVKGDFVVTFKDKNDSWKQGWPFDGTQQMQLTVKGDKTPVLGLKLKNQDADWKYEVMVTGGGNVTPLDPMIIVRHSFTFLDALPLLFAFTLGALAGVVGYRLVQRRRGLTSSS
jgi:hypothetical protein